MRGTQNIIPFDGEAFYYPSVFTPETADRLLDSLLSSIRWKQEPIKMFGRLIMQPRLTAWHGEVGKSYTYSGVTMHPDAWTAELQVMKQAVEEVARVRFNSALLNLYRDGNDSMGWHRDNEKMLGAEPIIASVSLGARRKFQFRNYRTKSVMHTMYLDHGSVLLMRGITQRHWEHRLPKSAGLTEPRINLTFRVL